MIRTSRLLAIVAVAAGATGCATFSDNSLAARVGSIELSQEELHDRVSGDLDDNGRVDAVAARTEIDDFVRRAIAEQTGLFTRYADGDPNLGVACFDALSVADRAQADDVVGRLGAGEPWTDVAESVAPGAAEASRVPCQAIAQVSPEIPEIADRLAELRPDGPALVLELPDQGATLVLRPHPIDEIEIVDFLNAVNAANPTLIELVQAEAADGDIYIDPRFGDFDPELFSVVPLG